MRRAVALLGVVSCGRVSFERKDASVTFESPDVPCVWNRQVDWRLGMQPGTSFGNPSLDSRLRPVWSFERVMGGPLGSPNVWYTQPATLMIWDDDWFGEPGAWALADNTPPNITNGYLAHAIYVDHFPNVPLVRWRNPFDTSVDVVISGTLRHVWHGDGDIGAPIDSDVVIAHVSAANTTMREIVGQRLSKPMPTYSRDELIIDVADTPVAMAAGDSIVMSVRSLGSDPGNYWMLIDDEITLTAPRCGL